MASISPSSASAAPALDDFYLRAAFVVVVSDNAIERTAIELPVIDEVQEISGRDRRLVHVQINFDVALAGGHHNSDRNFSANAGGPPE